MAETSEQIEHGIADELVKLLSGPAGHAVLKRALGQYHPADIAEALDELPDEKIHDVMSLLDRESVGQVLDEAGQQEIDEFIEEASVVDLTAIVDTMPPDEAADLLERVDEEGREAVLRRLSDDKERQLRELLRFQPDTAGGIMTTDFFYYSPGDTAADILDSLRREDRQAENFTEFFILGPDRELQGFIPIDDLLAARPDALARDLMDKAAVAVTLDTDQEVCARLMAKYDLHVLPVLGPKRRRLRGIITVDDILEVMNEEASEDIFRFAGMSDEPFEHGALVSAARRLPWFLITIAGMTVLSVIISQFQLTIQRVVAVSFFIPAIMGLGGNVGIQSATITIRGLATGEIDRGDFLWLLHRELITALSIGAVCALILGAVALGFSSLMSEADTTWTHSAWFAATIAIAMFVGILASAAMGTSIPMLCHVVGIDPAIASGPFVTTLVDITTQTLYLGLATVLLLA